MIARYLVAAYPHPGHTPTWLVIDQFPGRGLCARVVGQSTTSHQANRIAEGLGVHDLLQKAAVEDVGPCIPKEASA